MPGINRKCIIRQYELSENETFPNNTLPVLHYKKALQLPLLLPAAYIKKVFARNDWSNSWKDSVLTVHHYHSITHEVLGFYKGKGTLMLGGSTGVKIIVEKGDVLIIPAGISHKNLGSEKDIACVGAYPEGKEYDMNYGKKGERPKTDRNIAKVPLPAKDPVLGTKGGIKNFW